MSSCRVEDGFRQSIVVKTLVTVAKKEDKVFKIEGRSLI